MIPARFAPILQEMEPLAARFREAGHRLYLVGGTVRDLLLGDDSRPIDQMDFDATTTARPEETKKLVAGLADAVWTQGEKFGTIGLKMGTRVYEITTHRAEAYQADSRKPEVQYSDHIEADLARRDFTINAMALEVTGNTPALVDPHNGMADLMARVLRTPLSPEESFSDDPLRMLRAARFASQLSFDVDSETVSAMQRLRESIRIVSAERIHGELVRLMQTDDPLRGIRLLVETGLMEQFLPEVPALRLALKHPDRFGELYEIMDRVKGLGEAPTPEAREQLLRLDDQFHRWSLKTAGNRRVARIVAFADAHFAGRARPLSVLDVGAGLSVFLHGMKQHGFACTALDPDPRAAAHAHAPARPPRRRRWCARRR